MAEITVIAHPYAQALFNLAKQSHSENIWLDALSELEQITQNSEFVNVLNNPKVDNKEIITIIKSLLKDKVSEQVINLLYILIENNRLLVVAEIYHIFRKLVLADQGREDAVIESAYAISQTEKQEFEQLLSKKFGKTITATVVVNPDLMGGARVTINDKVIDGSVKGRLNNLATELTK